MAPVQNSMKPAHETKMYKGDKRDKGDKREDRDRALQSPIINKSLRSCGIVYIIILIWDSVKKK